MKVSPKKILFVYDLLHPIHKRLMESIGADFISKKDKPLKEYDIYIFEGSYIRPVLLKKQGKLGEDKKVISWISDPRLYYMQENKSFNFKKEEITSYPLFKKGIMLYFLKQIDGAICVGDMNLELFRKYSNHRPRVYVPGFVNNKQLATLRKVKPQLNNNNILFIGHGPDFFCKGIDIMVESFNMIKKEIKDAQLFIAGRWNIKREWKRDGIIFLGDVQNIEEIIEKCSLGIHLGRGEAFGVNIPEMMVAGLPVITSNLTGGKALNIVFNPKFITYLDKQEISRKVIDYLNLSLEEKTTLSKGARKAGELYAEDLIVKNFQKDMEVFLTEVNSDFKTAF